jgi:hypothetical protein
MGSLLLTRAEGARSPVFCAAGAEAGAPSRRGTYYESGCTLKPYAAAADDAALCQQLWTYALRELGVAEADALA